MSTPDGNPSAATTKTPDDVDVTDEMIGNGLDVLQAYCSDMPPRAEEMIVKIYQAMRFTAGD